MAPSAPQPPAPAFLEGVGPMGQFYAEKDWSRTGLGEPSTWSPQLKGYVDMMLRLPTPTILFWGPDQVQLYNLGYSDIMGPRHPKYLGEPYQDCWPDTYPTIYPMMRRVLDAGEVIRINDALIPVTRYGFNEETYFTFSFVPLRNANGEIEGILQPITETTRAVIAERRLATIRALVPRVSGGHDVVSEAGETLKANERDVPFAALYIAADHEKDLALAAHVGLPLGRDNFLAVAREVMTQGLPRLIDDVTVLVGEVPLGPWPEPARRAMVLPLQRSAAEPAQGVAVFGISSRLEFDDAYRAFFESAARELASNLLFEKESREKARLNLELSRRAEALTELDKAKTAFFSNVSHEFRTPITLIMGPVEELLADAALAPSLRERLETVLRNGQRLQKLVNALLDFARIEAGRAQATYQPTDLAKLTAELASTFQSAIERGGLRYVVECEPLSEPVYVDHDMWEKIVLNLLSNAFKFTFAGEVSVKLRTAGDYAQLEVKDTGVGVPASEVPHLFERFHRVQESRSRTHEGSGIGLAMVNELARLHGGVVAVESAVDVGTTFTVSIPFGNEHLPSERIAQTSPVSLGGTRTGAQSFVSEALRWLPQQAPSSAVPVPREEPRARILLADDNSDMRGYVRRVLEDRWEIDLANDGKTALERVQENPPDLLLTDVMMPGMDGFQLLKALRASPQTRDLPVVMLSARSGDEDRAVGLEAGANDYLVKPFSPRELVARVQAQLARRQERRIEERGRERMTRLFMLAPVGVALLRGPAHIYELANAEYLKLVGGREIVQKPIREALPELDGQGIYELLDGVRSTGQPFVGNELLVQLDQGRGEPEDRYFTFIYQPFPDEQGRPDGILVVVIDVTDQVTARRGLEVTREAEQQARADAERANRAKDEFLAMLGHELRNPLAPIVTAVTLMRLKGSGAVGKELDIIERQTTHLLTLVDDLLDVSRITRGKIELHPVDQELGGIVVRALEIASPLLEARHHRVHVQVPTAGLRVHVDAGRMAQVVSNLLTNAAKYTDPGGEIWVKGEVRGSHVALGVRDTGVGISAEMLPRVFDIFTQERQAIDRAQGGLGLGLAIVKNLVERHGGRVGVVSEGQGKGSEFVVELPLVAEAGTPPKGTSLEPAPPHSLEGFKVLVVDDNEDGAQTLAEAFELKGAIARVAHDGPQALAVLAEFSPEMAFLDLGLPAMDGYELARRIRELPGQGGIKLVALTGYGQDDDRRRSKEAGFDGHLTKPVSFEELYRMIEGLRG